MKNYPIEKYNFNYSADPNKVIAITHDAGEHIQATATCSPEDIYDEKIGKELAAARCNLKVATRKLRRAVHKVDETELDLAAVKRSLIDAKEFLEDANEQYNSAFAELQKIENQLR